MKPIKIKYGKGKQLLITRDVLKVGIGLIIIIGDALLAGIIQLFEFGFDMSYLFSSEFWTAYSIKLVISYVALFGAYVIRKVKNRHNPKFVVQRERIKDCKKEIVKAKKIGVCKNWLKFVFNYKKKVEIYQEIITKKYEKLIFTEPEKPNKDDYDMETWLGKRKYKRAMLIYNKKYKKYAKSESLRKYYEEQLTVCEIHLQIIQAYKEHNIEKAKSLQKQIENIDCMKNYKLHYKSVTYNRLFNVDLGNVKHDDSIEYNEASILIKKILPAIFGGLISVALLTSVIVHTKSFTAETVLLIALNLIVMIWFVFTGIRLADSFVLGVVYTADSNRIMICEEFLEDSALNGDSWVENIDTDTDTDVKEEQNETAGSTQIENVEEIEDIKIPHVRAPK